MGFPGLLNVFLTPSTTLGVVAAIGTLGREDSTERVGPMLVSQDSQGRPLRCAFLQYPCLPSRALMLRRAAGSCCLWSWWPGGMPIRGTLLDEQPRESFQGTESILGVIPLGGIGMLEGKSVLSLRLYSVP